MKAVAIKCPNCGANLYRPDPDAICVRIVAKCEYCRSYVLIDFINGEDGVRVMQEATVGSDWNESGEAIFNGNYYDVEELL